MHQCISVITFKLVNNACLCYLNEVTEYAPHCKMIAGGNTVKLKSPFPKTNMGQKGFSYIGSFKWINLPGSMKKQPF